MIILWSKHQKMDFGKCDFDHTRLNEGQSNTMAPPVPHFQQPKRMNIMQTGAKPKDFRYFRQSRHQRKIFKEIRLITPQS